MTDRYPTMLDDETPVCLKCKQCADRHIDDEQPPTVCLKLGCFIVSDNQCSGIYYESK